MFLKINTHFFSFFDFWKTSCDAFNLYSSIS